MFGIKAGQFSCEHPVHSDKRLWTISDFPHLLKCFRNGIVQHEWFDTPEGRVFLRHFMALVRYEGYTKPNLSVAYFLTPAHLDPKGFQKMNVPLAFELFSEKVKVAMEVYKDDPECVDLHDSEPAIKLVEIVNNLIHAMMFRVPANALRPLDKCPQKKAIEDFLCYLREWGALAKKPGQPTEPADCSLAALLQRDHQYLETASHSERDRLSCHDYDVVRTSDTVQTYIAGYIARKCIRLTRCFARVNRLKTEDRCEQDAVIVKMNRLDGLVCPSEELFKLTKSLEAIVLDGVRKFGIKRSTFHRIVEKVQELGNVTLVGCLDHEHDVTKRAISMYLFTRANFLATSLNKNTDARRLGMKMHRKNAEL